MRLIVTIAATFFIVSTALADDWPQWLGPKRDGIWREKGILKTFPQGGPKIRWRTAIAAGYAGPAVANGRVYVMDRQKKGGIGKRFSRGNERVLCLDESTGKILWQHTYNRDYAVGYSAGPRVTPIVAGGKVYTLGTMGNLLCLDAESGKVNWSKDLMKEYDAPQQTWGFSAHPLLDGDRMICMVGGNAGVVAAFHKDTGKEMWRALPDRRTGYTPPVIYEIGGKRQLIVWHPQAVTSLNPETGKEYWSQPFRIRVSLTIAMPRLEDDRLFVSAFYNGSLMLQLDKNKPAARVLWKGKSNRELPEFTDALHCLMSTPVTKDGFIYGVCSYGELRCLKADTGKRLWSTLKAATGESARWGNAFLIPHENRYFIFNELGDLIIAKLSPKGYDEVCRHNILAPTNRARGRRVVWSHPAFANRCMYVRNDREIVCVSLNAE